MFHPTLRSARATPTPTPPTHPEPPPPTPHPTHSPQATPHPHPHPEPHTHTPSRATPPTPTPTHPLPLLSVPFLSWLSHSGKVKWTGLFLIVGGPPRFMVRLWKTALVYEVRDLFPWEMFIKMEILCLLNVEKIWNSAPMNLSSTLNF